MTPDPAVPAPSSESVPPAESSAVAESPSSASTPPAHDHHGPRHTHCENCGTELKGPYCHACGQHDFDTHRSFGHTALEALENFFHFDAKFFRNIVTLLFRPGVLTAEFNAGKRASQMPPFRLYVFTAFFFFLTAFSLQDESRAIDIDTGGAFPSAPAATAPSDAPGSAPQPRNQPRASFVPLEKSDAEKTKMERWAEKQAARVTQPEFRRELTQHFLAAVPKLFLLCLPIFALFTRVLFRGRGQFYLQHLILALHFHTFIFLWILFRDGWEFLLSLPGGPMGRVAEFVGNAWLALYPLLMLHRLFAESWLRTLLKTVALALGYVLTLALVFFLSVLAIVLFI